MLRTSNSYNLKGTSFDISLMPQRKIAFGNYSVESEIRSKLESRKQNDPSTGKLYRRENPKISGAQSILTSQSTKNFCGSRCIEPSF
jgi:hypothetical protein